MRSTMSTLVVLAALTAAGPALAQQQGRVQTYTAPPPRAQDRDLPPMNAGQAAEVNRLINPFFERVKTGQTREAFTLLVSEALVSKRPDLIDQLKSITDLFLETYGAVTGWELADSACLTADICRVLYVMHTPQLPVYFEFTLYRRPAGWTLTNVNITDIPNAIF